MKNKHKQIQAGDVFATNEGGSVTVVAYLGWDNIHIVHNDEYQHHASCHAQHLRNGSIKNPYHASVYGTGFIGSGKYRAKSAGKHTKAYLTWKSMLQRCYDEKYIEKKPTYYGCSVATVWHNFQSFAEWYHGQHKEHDWQIDKDLIVTGNKQYSPDSCAFVPQQINSILLDSSSSRGNLPLGVTESRGKYRARIRVNNIPVDLGIYITPEEAFIHYKLAKEYNVKIVAERYKKCIDPRVYEALMRYEATP